MFHFKSWLMVTPSNLALVTNSRGLPFRTRGSKSWLLLENPIRSSLHLPSFSWMSGQQRTVWDPGLFLVLSWQDDMSLISLIFLILHLKVIIYYNSQNAANNTTMFNINPFFFSQQIHSPLACFNDHLHCTSFVSFPYMRWPFWLRSGRQIILFTYLFSILLLFFII